MNFFRISFIILSLSFFAACKNSKHYEADISDVRIDPIEIKRYEEVLFNINPNQIKEDLEPHLDDFGLFLGDNIDNEWAQRQLYDYITDPFISELYAETSEAWVDLSELEQELTLAFRYYKYHFPDWEIPRVYSYVSGLDFELPVKYHESNIIIGLDMFMGPEYAKYERIGIPAFKRNRFLKEATPVEVIRTLAEDYSSPLAAKNESLLDHIIFEGKLLYFLDCMLPKLPDSLKMYYSTEHIEWAERNHGRAWSYILENELLYSSDRQMVQKFVGPAPFSAPFSRNSAPRIGSYIGWQMVREYARRNKDVGLQTLFFEKSPREILTKSRYRP